ncbi:acyl-CoA ligase (AMP-forming), exosortase A system-associated [Burkholderia oklahomensis]|uniref:AMP-binding enzyme family protein n=1 Tax=Burkholderia oklahomensis TaxID=342113 RepID=A0AAI8FQL9_9BURK|nr:acyl-CoA ligase (AMP-forming), exosortase A system-associated [Burkholderia oklahomensis]AIO69110.1 AMP-binding enzyme family protein [Burkholderia oklahomensis]QPS40648.1 acyl-CoA ligase (AMP-forming), exosortase A system-associated [Burkholderia oklahomensis]
MNPHIRLVDLLDSAAAQRPDGIAIADPERRISYAQFAADVRRVAVALAEAGFTAGERVAIYAAKTYETITVMLAANLAGAIIVPINPQLRDHQVLHILADCGARLLLSTPPRLSRLAARPASLVCWLLDDIAALPEANSYEGLPPTVDTDPAAILYTSGSTGNPKGVVLSHRNLTAGADSVAAFQQLEHDDVILGALPLSFDAGLNQLTSALAAKACYAPLDFLRAEEVPECCVKAGVTSITGVPPLWMRLATVEWPDDARLPVRRLANTGGVMPASLLHRLRDIFPNAAPYLMYGLTEAFRSTYLSPGEVGARPDSIGKAVPNAQILVLRPDGSECDADEPGELVHRGAFVTLGYWNAPELTAQRFRPLPRAHHPISLADVAVWSGDIVRRDAAGFLYFVGRADEMIKTSGYRVSPTEIEDILFECEETLEAAAFGVPHPTLGQVIIAYVYSTDDPMQCRQALVGTCSLRLPSYMVPQHIEVVDSPLPRNPNGKIDRPLLKRNHLSRFEAAP